jgi:nucleoside-diphosphate-sugar epimerase
MGSTVLVTGGFGFIGANLVRELLLGGSRVLVIDREIDGNSADEVLSAEQRASVVRVTGAIPGARALTRLLREHAVETVVHLASPLSTLTETRPRAVTDQMVAPHQAILEASRLAEVRRVVWASSIGVFGRALDYPRLPIPNDASHRPLTLYGAAKSFLERMSSQYTDRYGLETVGLRFALVYGPGRRRGGGQFTTQLIEGAALGRRCVVESADEKYSWMYVADAARSVLMAMRAERVASRALTVGGPVATTREVAGLLGNWFPEAELDVRGGTSDLVADFDPAPAFEQLGYAPATTLREGVLATANAARRRAGLEPVG